MQLSIVFSNGDIPLTIIMRKNKTRVHVSHSSVENEITRYIVHYNNLPDVIWSVHHATANKTPFGNFKSIGQ